MASNFSSVIRYPASNPKASKHYLIFYMTGNPGLVEYYRPFLDRLNKRLSSPQRSQGHDASFEIYSRSFAGFETSRDEAARQQQQQQQSSGSRPPYTLKEELDKCEATLREAVATSAHPSKTRVILAGHSLGGWTTLELISRLRERLLLTHRQSHNGKDVEEPDVVAGICLFTPVTHLARSPGGRRGAVLLRIPFATSFLVYFARFLSLLPTTWLNSLVHRVTGMPPNQAAVTAAFIASPHGVRQALSLVNDELATITDDRWSDEVWGAATKSVTGVERARLYFYFGGEDQYVLRAEREELLRQRCTGAEEWRPKMEVDANGVPHAFVMRNSEEIADKVAEYVEEIASLELAS